MKSITTCKDCQNRYVGCHGLCEKYKKARAEHNKLKEELNNYKRIENDLRKYHVSTYDRLRKRNNIH